MSNRYYIYKLPVDNGGAPCDQDNLLTLAICKPAIRSTARKGNWIFGVGGEPLGHRLIYIAQVTGRSINGDYYGDYPCRRDSIYYKKDNEFETRPSARYHKNNENRSRDIGEPPQYSKANVLLSNNYRYLGDKGVPVDKSKYPEIDNLLRSLRQGHRVNHSDKLRKELEKLQKDLWRQYPDRCSIGKPINEVPKSSKDCC